MSDATFTVALLRQVANLLGKLSPQQVADLADGRAHLAFVSAGTAATGPEREGFPRGASASSPRAAPTKRTEVPRPSVADVVSHIARQASREDVAAYLAGAGLRIKDLRDVAAKLEITIRKTRKDDIIRELAEGAAGYKQKFETLMGGEWRQ